MDVRQGTLEHDALTAASLYNRIITAGGAGGLSRMHTKPATLFCICPGPELEVGTFEFWKLGRYADRCYSLMYNAMRSELQRFDFSVTNREVWMTKVDRTGAIAYEDFTLR